jgi:preprotein translocase subunit YajC
LDQIAGEPFAGNSQALAAGGATVLWKDTDSVYILLVFIVVLLVFSMVQNNRRRKQTATMQQAIQPGVRVMTTSGIYGLVSEVETDTIVVEISEGVDVRFDKRAVMKVVPHLTDDADDTDDTDTNTNTDGTDTDGSTDKPTDASRDRQPALSGSDDASGHE